MSKRKADPLWIIVGIVALIVVFAAIIYYFSKNERVGRFRDNLKSRGEELRNKILEKENFVQWIKNQIYDLKMMKSDLITKAKRLYLMVKCLALVLIVGVLISLHAIWSLNVVELVLTIVSTGTVIIGTLMIVITNQVTGINKVLDLCECGFIKFMFTINSFEPGLIDVLECRLIEEEKSLVQLKEEYNKFQR